MIKNIEMETTIKLVWGVLFLEVLTQLINKWVGNILLDTFFSVVVLYGFMCIIPYKLSRKSNAARYVWTVFFAANLLFVLADSSSLDCTIDNVSFVLLLPLHVFIIYSLFNSHAKEYFGDKNERVQDKTWA